MWEVLRKRKFLGLKFRRQQPLGPYIVDFLCIEKKLAIEVDGTVHKNSKEYDTEKDLYLEGAGFRVLRLPADIVENNLPKALEMIRKTLLLKK